MSTVAEAPNSVTQLNVDVALLSPEQIRAVLGPEAIQRMAEAFVMPDAQPGTPVVWYDHGIRKPRPDRVGFVARVAGSKRTVHISIPGMAYLESVPHIDDPALNASESRRENGAWDYTDAHKADLLLKAETAKKIAELTSRLDLLESLVTEPKKAAKKE